MREKLLLAANLALLAGSTLFLATLQTSLWFQVFGWFPAPVLWVPALVYASLSRSAVEMVLALFAISVILSTMTVMPDGLLFTVCMLAGVSVRLVKQRFYWTGSSYFMMASGFAALMFNLFHWLLTLVSGEAPLASPEVTDWLIQALLTPLVAPPLYDIYRWFDKLTEREHPAEASANIV